jgi:hypothetical protein
VGGLRKRINVAGLPLDAIRSVVFFKRDLLTYDLICCEVDVAGRLWEFDEEMEGWETATAHLAQLPNFRSDWIAAVMKPAFESCRTVAYKVDA